MKIIGKIRNSDSSRIFIYNFIIAILNFSTTVILIRILDPNEFGTYVIIYSFITLIHVLFGLKTGEAIIKYIKSDTNKAQKQIIIRQLLSIDIIVNILLYLLISISGFYYAKSVSIEYHLILTLGTLVFVNIGFNIFENLYIINNEIVKLHQIKLVGTFLVFAFTLSLGMLFKLEGVVIGLLIGSFLKNILHFYFIRKEIIVRDNQSGRNNYLSIQKYLHFFKHTYISSTFKAGSQGLDIFMLSLVFGNDKIALYEIGKKFAQIPGLIIGSIWTSKSKLIVKYSHQNDEKSLYKLISRNYKLFIPLGIIFGLIFLIIGKDILAFIFGPSYIQSFSIAFIFFIFYWFGNLFGGFARLYLIAINRPKILTILNSLIFFNVLILGYFTRHNLTHMALTIGITVLFNGLYLNYFIIKRIDRFFNN